MLRIARVAALVAVIASTAVHAQSPYSTVYVFGDSISDRGRIPGLILQQNPNFPPSELFPKPPYFDARFSNGPTYAELLPGLIGAAVNPGLNFAVGGAFTNTQNLANDFLPGGLTLPGIRTEIDSFTGSGGRFDPSAVVVHFGGANDYFAFLNPLLPPPAIGQVPGAVAAVTGNIQSNIQALAGAGAKTILVPNIPDLASTPGYRGTPFAGVAGALSAQHAAALNAQLGGLAKQLNVNIYVVDFATGFQTALANPGLFGFTNVTDACVKSLSEKQPPYIAPGPPCSNPDQYLFWDDVHPTAAAHRLLAQYAADTLLAPLSIAAQAAFSLTNGDNFLRRMQEAVLATGVPGLSSPILKGTLGGGNVFLNIQRSFGDGSQATNALGFDYGVTQVSGGAIVRPSNNVALGLIGGFDDGTATLDWSRGSIDLTSFRLGAMGGFDNGALYAGAGAAISYDDYALHRQTFVPQLRSAADPDGHSVSGFGSVGYRFDFGSISAGPLLALRYTNVHIDEYREHGAPGLDMIVQSQRADELIGSAGIAAAARFAVWSAIVSPYLNLALEQDFLHNDRIIETALVTVSNVGRTHQIGADGDVFGRLNAGVAFTFAPGFTGIVRGETTIDRSGGNEHAIFGTISGRL